MTLYNDFLYRLINFWKTNLFFTFLVGNNVIDCNNIGQIIVMLWFNEFSNEMCVTAEWTVELIAFGWETVEPEAILFCHCYICSTNSNSDATEFEWNIQKYTCWVGWSELQFWFSILQANKYVYWELTKNSAIYLRYFWQLRCIIWEIRW